VRPPDWAGRPTLLLEFYGGRCTFPFGSRGHRFPQHGQTTRFRNPPSPSISTSITSRFQEYRRIPAPHSIRCAGRDDVPRIKRDRGGNKRNQHRNSENQIRSVGILHQRSIDAHANREGMRVRHGVARVVSQGSVGQNVSHDFPRTLSFVETRSRDS